MPQNGNNNVSHLFLGVVLSLPKKSLKIGTGFSLSIKKVKKGCCPKLCFNVFCKGACIRNYNVVISFAESRIHVHSECAFDC